MRTPRLQGVIWRIEITRLVNSNVCGPGDRERPKGTAWHTPGLRKCFLYASKHGNLSSGHRARKDQFSFQSQRMAVPKNVQTTMQVYSFLMLVRFCSKSFKLGFNSSWTGKFQLYNLDLEKAEEPEIKLLTSIGSQKKQENSSITSASASLTILKLLIVWITTNCGKFWKRWEYQTTLPVSCMLVKKQQLELDMERRIGSRLGKAVYCLPDYSTSMQSTSCELQGWKTHKLESGLLGEISASDMQMTTP